jgi:hypothetical protein
MSGKIRRGDSIFVINESKNPQTTISPLNVYQDQTGSINFSVSTIGNSGAMSYTWNAKNSDGTSVNQHITGSGSSITFNTSLPKQVAQIFVTGTDSLNSLLKSYSTALVSVGDPPSLFAPTAITESLPAGTTSASFAFATASGGFGTISYTLSNYGPGSLSTLTGRSGSISPLSNNDVSKVVLTCTDQFSQVVTSSYIVGIAANPVFDEEANWGTIYEIDFTNIGTGSLSGTGSVTIGGITFTLLNLSGTPTHSISASSNGLRYVMSGTAATSQASNLRFAISGGISNYTPAEHILLDMVTEIEKQNYPYSFNMGMGDGLNINDLDSFSIRLSWTNATTGSIDARRYQSETASAQSIGSTTDAFSNSTFSGQILMDSQRIPLMTVTKTTDYLGGPKLGLSAPMRGTWTGSPGGSGVTASSSLASAFSTINMHFVLSNTSVVGNSAVIIKKIRFRRLTRPPST